jgi:murein DD-endopeptidase MepM/ murein hydrolase activator NlpD
MIALLLCLLLAPPAAFPAGAEAIQLTRPWTRVCEVSPDAEYVLEDGDLKPVRGFFAFSPPGAAALVPSISVPAEAAPGAPVRVRVLVAEPLESLSVTLQDSKSRPLARVSVFKLPSAEGQGEQWAALAGVPSTAAPGSYLLEVNGSRGERSFLLRAQLAVAARAFPAETISLTGPLSALRATPDARKTEEARELARVLGLADPGAVHETGRLVLPVAGEWRRTGSYGDRRRYRYSDGGVDATVHNGLDMAALEGTPVAAAGKGRVVLSAERIMTGRTVVVEHLPGVFSIYYHLSAALVAQGDILEAGQALGKVGMTGFATGNHLHWEVQVLGTPVDPESFVRQALLDTSSGFGDIQGHTGSEGR